MSPFFHASSDSARMERASSMSSCPSSLSSPSSPSSDASTFASAGLAAAGLELAASAGFCASPPGTAAATCLPATSSPAAGPVAGPGPRTMIAAVRILKNAIRINVFIRSFSLQSPAVYTQPKGLIKPGCDCRMVFADAYNTSLALSLAKIASKAFRPRRKAGKPRLNHRYLRPVPGPHCRFPDWSDDP
ncbi:MAG: hypothetical protein CSYNP_04541 [Syntrophus sp. SKADARSKE-3]|nr:hypothetical protein [Syntrophus sp. SKADARSKE-3]